MGGTNIRAARIADGKVLAQKAQHCKADGTEQEVLSQIFSLIEGVADPSVTRIGIGVPSVVDSGRGIVYDLQNIPSWREVHVKEILEKRFGVPVAVDNDVNCFVLGEKHFGVGSGCDSVVGITLGTGVGAGIITNGQLYRGANTGAGEVGCLPYLDSDYEHYCSSQFFARHATTGADEAAKAARGDTAALALWHEFGRHLGRLLQAVLFAYDPQLIVIGGGIAASHGLFGQSMIESMKDGFPYAVEAENVRVEFSSVKDCNMLGASVL